MAMRSMGINRANIHPEIVDMGELKSEQVRYVRAQEFIRRMRRHRRELTFDQMRDLRRIALDGDIMGANRAMWDILENMEVEHG